MRCALTWAARRSRLVLASAPLWVRVMAVAAILVTVTSAVTGWLGITLLSGYLLGRIEAAYRARAAGEARALDSEDRMRRFVADASHELRTPLTSVRGLAEFSLQQGGAASQAELLRLMSLIQQEAIRMGRLVEDLLLLAQFDEHRPLDCHPVDLSSIAAEAVRAAAAVRRGHVITVQAAEPVIVHGDHGRLRQIIDNLIGNAVQHTRRAPRSQSP